jgi:hypothetical protein
MNMNRQLDILDRRYQGIKGATGDWPIFLGIADYVKYAASQPRFKKVIKEIVRPREEYIGRLDEMQRKGAEELDSARDEIIKRIKLTGVEMGGAVEENLSAYEKWKKGDIRGTLDMCEGMEDQLSDLVRYLWENGHRDVIASYVIPLKDDPNYIGKFVISKTMNERQNLKEEMAKEKGTALWGNWDDLVSVYATIYEGEKLYAAAGENKDMWKLLNLGLVLGEMKSMRESAQGRNRANVDISIFKREKYLSSLDRVHLHLLEYTGDYRSDEKINNIKSIGLPSGTQLEDVTLKIINDYDFEVWVAKAKIDRYSYIDLGCLKSNTKEQKPDEQWKFLNTLASCNGNYSYKKYYNDTSAREKIRQQKSKLSKRLAEFLGLGGEPIIDEDMTYRTVFKLEPDPQIRGDGEIHGVKDLLMKV